MAKAALKKITNRARQLYNAPGNRKDWQACIKAASKEYNSGSTAKKRQTGSSNKKRDSSRKAKPPGKRKSRTGRTYTERRKNRSDAPGSVTGLTIAQLKSGIKKKLKEGIDKVVVQIYHAPGKRLKSRLRKKLNEKKQQLKKLL